MYTHRYLKTFLLYKLTEFISIIRIYSDIHIIIKVWNYLRDFLITLQFSYNYFTQLESFLYLYNFVKKLYFSLGEQLSTKFFIKLLGLNFPKVLTLDMLFWWMFLGMSKRIPQNLLG